MVRFGVGSLLSVVVCACSASTRVGPGHAGEEASPAATAERFAQLEATAVEATPGAVLGLPEEAESEPAVLLLLEATVDAPAFDELLQGYVLQAPAEWSLGASDEGGEEVRVAFLEPEGGMALLRAERDLGLRGEVAVTWLARYERRNVLLTGEGTSTAVHLTPVAARLEAEAAPALFWVATEAPSPAP